jgi:hypothetical protein
MKNIIFVLSIVMTLSSCSYYAFYPQPRSQTYLATNPDSIKIYSGDIEQEYLVIGSVASMVPGNLLSTDKGIERAKKVFKKHTAKLGADAIIHLKTTGNTGNLSGVAVKFK